jgi:hypothetical protein
LAPGFPQLRHCLVDERLENGEVLLGMRLGRKPVGEARHHVFKVCLFINEDAATMLLLLVAG